MKKLLILMLVLGLTSVANAGLVGVELSVNGATDGSGNTTEITITTCSTLVIDVHGPAGSGWTGVVAIMGSFPNVTGGEWGDPCSPTLPMCSSYYYDAPGYPIVHEAAGDDAAYARRYEYADWGYGYELQAASFSGEPTGGLQFELLYHCCDIETVTIQIFDDVEWAVADTIIVTQIIPEPMTIALLGLGGLLLRRRK